MQYIGSLPIVATVYGDREWLASESGLLRNNSPISEGLSCNRDQAICREATRRCSNRVKGLARFLDDCLACKAPVGCFRGACLVPSDRPVL